MQYSSLFSSNRISEWRVFAPLHFGLDILALTIGWNAARTWALPVHLRGAIPSALIIVGLWTLTAFARGLYRRKEAWTAAHAIRQAVESDLAACGLALFAGLFVNRTSTEVSRAFVLAFAPSSLALLVLSFYAAMMITGAIQKMVRPQAGRDPRGRSRDRDIAPRFRSGLLRGAHGDGNDPYGCQ